MARQHIIGVRVEEERLEQFERAAKREGKKLSEWLRDLAITEIAAPLSSVVREKRTPQPAYGTTRLSPAEIAASIPGVKLGTAPEAFIGEDGQMFQFAVAQDPNSFDVANAPTEEITTKPWLPELTRITKLSEFDPGSATEELNALIGSLFRPPKGWMAWSLQKRAAYLDETHPLEGK